VKQRDPGSTSGLSLTAIYGRAGEKVAGVAGDQARNPFIISAPILNLKARAGCVEPYATGLNKPQDQIRAMDFGSHVQHTGYRRGPARSGPADGRPSSRGIATSDGHFLLWRVKTTGVYCRPSCAARAAKPNNVQLLPQAARTPKQAGFRPCKRCKAKASPSFAEAACREGRGNLPRTLRPHRNVPKPQRDGGQGRGEPPLISTGSSNPSPAWTPRAYAVAHRAKRVRDALAERRAGNSDLGAL